MLSFINLFDNTLHVYNDYTIIFESLSQNVARSQFIVFNSFHSFPVIHFCESKQMTAKILRIRLDNDGLQKFVGLVTYIKGKAKRFK